MKREQTKRWILCGMWALIALGSMIRAAMQFDFTLMAFVGIASIVGLTVLWLVRLVAH